MGIYSLFPPSLRNNQERERKWFSGQGLSLLGGVCVGKEGAWGKGYFYRDFSFQLSLYYRLHFHMFVPVGNWSKWMAAGVFESEEKLFSCEWPQLSSSRVMCFL